MAIPKQVREAEERSEQLIKERNQPATEPAPDATPNAEAAEAPPATPPADTVAEPTDDGPPEKQDRIDWKSKYHVLQGKYNAEVPRLHADLKAERDRVRETERQNAELRQEVAALQKAATAAPKGPTEVDEAISMLRQEYGEGVVERIEQIIAHRVGEAVKPLQGKVEQTEAERQARRENEEQARKAGDFADAVNKLVPDWERIDAMPEFKAYLAEVGSDGRSRQDELIDACRNYDAAGAASIFTVFKHNHPAYQQLQSTKPRAKDPPSLTAQVVPESSGRDRDTPTAKIWTRKEVTAFYHDLAQGKYRANPERATEIERDIEAAQRENRIR